MNIPPRSTGDIAQELADRVTVGELTPRELEVLTLIAQGHSNKRIGRRLSITEGTVKTHVKGILGKLGVTGRGEAIGMAHRRGLVRL
jgi:two-component system NarL family response regulator